jgi:hypothetical protein
VEKQIVEATRRLARFNQALIGWIFGTPGRSAATKPLVCRDAWATSARALRPSQLLATKQ